MFVDTSQADKTNILQNSTSFCLRIERLFYGTGRGLLMPDGRHRADIKIGSKVRIVEKKNQPSGKLTDSLVQQIVTLSPDHRQGIKVKLTSRLVGHIQEIIC